MADAGPGVEQWDPGRVRRRSRLHALLRLLRVEHTLFSLPFPLLGAELSGHPYTLSDALLMLAAVVGLRSLAMAWNNLADLDIDRLNPRTRGRPLASGALPASWALAAMLTGFTVYYLSAVALNSYAALLTPLPLAAALLYPHAKRLHPLPHIQLGLALGLVVFGGAVAAAGDEAGSLWEVLAAVPWGSVAAVTLWVAGFDVIYSVMDLEFDKRMGLGSLPALLGRERARLVAAAMHAAAAILLARDMASLGGPGLAAALAAAALMLGQHLVAAKRPSLAFNMNLAVPIIVALGLAPSVAESLAGANAGV